MTTPIAELVKRLRAKLRDVMDAHNATVGLTNETDGNIVALLHRKNAALGALEEAAVEALPTLLDALEALSAPPSEVEAVAQNPGRYTREAAHIRDALIDFTRRNYLSDRDRRKILTARDTLMTFAMELDEARAAIAALPRRDEGERMREALAGLVAVVQYRRQDSGQWSNMAAFDSDSMAERYCQDCERTNSEHWAYRWLPRAALTPEPR